MMSRTEKEPRKKQMETAGRIAVRIRELREQRGWKQIDLGQKLGIKRTSISNYEQGTNLPPLPMLEKLAQVFGVSLDGLVWGAEAPEQAIQDRELLALFKRADSLNHRAKALVLEVLEAILLKEEQPNHVKSRVA